MVLPARSAIMAAFAVCCACQAPSGDPAGPVGTLLEGFTLAHTWTVDNGVDTFQDQCNGNPDNLRIIDDRIEGWLTTCEMDHGQFSIWLDGSMDPPNGVAHVALGGSPQWSGDADWAAAWEGERLIGAFSGTIHADDEWHQQEFEASFRVWEI
jgi:hypothetical protein